MWNVFAKCGLRFIGTIGRFVSDDQGPTATEYAVMLAMILMAAIGAIGTFGGTLKTMFVNIGATLFAA